MDFTLSGEADNPVVALLVALAASESTFPMRQLLASTLMTH
ncbi:hypothetical protein [Arthrobacter sp. E3]|nr:hypothetical protein [Arthrobacter sp. E3]